MKKINQIRQQIDAVDQKLVELIEQRAELVLAISVEKQALGLDAHIPEREQQIVESLHQRFGDKFSLQELQEVYQAIFKASVRIQKS
ncbi:MAG: chorismate mutase [Kangiellaceae bacterium]|nr:chorismate mutase [Kangiellaceae bacterium]